ncbi:MAG: hypothetical protein IPH52_22100 [Leptospiraceae bacterium]|nr:hypothetical protein [Leptospiraceae bacterium]
MNNAYILTGFMKDKFTIQLDEAFSLPESRVRIIIEPISKEVNKSQFVSALEKIRKRQAKRKFIPTPKSDAINFYLSERDSWG